MSQIPVIVDAENIKSVSDLETLLLRTFKVSSLTIPLIESVERYSDLPLLQYKKRNGLKVKLGGKSFFITIEE